MPQLTFDSLAEREKQVVEKEKALANFCRHLLSSINEIELDALKQEDKSIKAGKLFAIKRIRDSLKYLPS